MGRYRAIDYTSGGNDFAGGLGRGMDLAMRGIQLYQMGKKIREDEARKEAMQEVAEAEAVQEVNPRAAAMASDYGAAAQRPEVMAAPGASELYKQAAEGVLTAPESQQYRLGDVTSDKPLTPEQVSDARIGLKQAALMRLGDAEGATKAGAERVQMRQAAQQAELTGIQLTDAKNKQADDAQARSYRDKVGEFMEKRLTVTDGNGNTSRRAATDDDWIAASLHQAELYANDGRTQEALQVQRATREYQANLLQVQAQERRRAGAEVLARLQANPADTAAAAAYYDKYLPDGKKGELKYDPKTDAYTLFQDGKAAHTLGRKDMFNAIAATADTGFALNFLDQEAKRASINKDNATAAAAGREVVSTGDGVKLVDKGVGKVVADIGTLPPSKDGSSNTPQGKKLDFIRKFQESVKSVQDAGKTQLSSYNKEEATARERVQSLAVKLASRIYDNGQNPDPAQTLELAERIHKAGKGNLPMPADEKEFSKLKKGEEFIAPDGSIRVK